MTRKLLTGALRALERHGVSKKHIDTVWVPGAFEIPAAAQKLARSGRYDALVCLGAVIRGETAHFEVVATEASRGIAEVGLRTGVAVGFGVLTTENVRQALARAGGKQGNKGADAAEAALEMADLLGKIRPKAR